MRSIASFLIDVVMIVVAFEVLFTTTGSLMWAGVGVTIIAAYGAWCFADGVARALE